MVILILWLAKKRKKKARVSERYTVSTSTNTDFFLPPISSISVYGCIDLTTNTKSTLTYHVFITLIVPTASQQTAPCNLRPDMSGSHSLGILQLQLNQPCSHDWYVCYFSFSNTAARLPIFVEFVYCFALCFCALSCVCMVPAQMST